MSVIICRNDSAAHGYQGAAVHEALQDAAAGAAEGAHDEARAVAQSDLEDAVVDVLGVRRGHLALRDLVLQQDEVLDGQAGGQVDYEPALEVVDGDLARAVLAGAVLVLEGREEVQDEVLGPSV